MTLSNLNSAPRAVFILLAMLQITAMKLDNGPKSKLLKNSPLISKYKETKEVVTTALTKNPLAQSIIELYDFFYWLPRRNVIYEHPPVFWLNNTIQYLGWYQVPHNLPPYGYLPNAWPADFFCYGLPGNTLPLGNWDPFGLHMVSRKVVRKYRESELKHGRLAMIGCLSTIVQENFHPLHPEIGGLVISHMDQLARLPLEDNLLVKLVPFVAREQIASLHISLPVDYILIMLALMSIESFALVRNWTRWLPNEYNHQFDHNIGVGNLKESYENGNYGFDPCGLTPENQEDKRVAQEIELNHARLAMVSFVGIVVQEFVTGYPAYQALSIWLESKT